jgi:6-pyruvoyltetrahydropterin/6-carboxytetrahydropterin synthase
MYTHPRKTVKREPPNGRGYNLAMIRITREVRFSVDRDWAGHIQPARRITNAWAGWPSAVGVVPYLRFRATAGGRPDPVSGYLCSTAVLDRLLREHALPDTAGRLHTRGWRVPAEELLRAVWEQVAPQMPADTPLVRLELRVTPFLGYAIQREDPQMILLTQQFEFSAAHRLHCPELPAEENRRLFGKCNNPRGHGHNYLVDVTVARKDAASTGIVLPLPRFEEIVQEYAIDVLDHKHLNEDVEQFRHLNPTVENIARVIWDMLVDRVAPARLHAVRVYETPKSWADCTGD